MHCAAYPHTIGVHYDVAGRRIRRGIGVRRSADGDGSHGARYRHARAASATTVTVQYAATGGTASGGVDYTVAGSGTLTFAPGVTTQNIIVNVIGDTDVEPDETVVMTLSSPVGATLASASATGTILNDDAALPPALSILLGTPVFAHQPLATTSAPVSVTIGNTGGSALTLGTPFPTMSAGDFALVSVPNACTAGESLAVSATCNLHFTFTPSATGIAGYSSSAIDARPVPHSQGGAHCMTGQYGRTR